MHRALWFAPLVVLLGCDRRPSVTFSTATRPQFGAWGIDLAAMDTTVRPGDDFFTWANGTWLAHAVIPADKTALTLRTAMSDTTEARLHAIMAAAAKLPADSTGLAAKIGAYWRSFMNSTAVEQAGTAPLAPTLDSIRAATTTSAVAALTGRSSRDFYAPLFSVYIDVDLKDPTIYSVYLNQAGLTLPDRDYYLTPGFAATRAAFEHDVAMFLRLIDWPDADARAADVVAFQTAVARANWNKVQQRDMNAEYNPMSVDALVRFAPGFDWKAFLREAGLASVTRVVVGEKSAFPSIAAVFARTPIATLQAWQAFSVAYQAAPFLSSQFTHAFFALHDSTLAGQQAEKARWKRAVHAIAGGDYLAGDRFDRFGSVGFGSGELYTARYFPPSAKAKIEELVANLKAAYRTRIEQLDWMSPPTRAEALKKLDTYTIKVGYPDRPRDYTRLVLRDDDLLGDARRAAAADWDFYVDRMHGPVDRSDWLMTPQTNDAYNGSLRDIVFPAGILQPPIFDPNADPAVNYGAAGAVVGHELTHGFDDEGRKVDAEGRLRDWWQPADARAFEARARVLATQYSAFQPLPGVHVNGELTLGENIADLGGVTLALDAYRASLHGQASPVLGGVTGDQRVFLGWAQAWRGKLTEAAVRQQVVSDPHSPRSDRINGPVRNIDAWYTAFNVAPSDSLYLPPAQRVRIW